MKRILHLASGIAVLLVSVAGGLLFNNMNGANWGNTPIPPITILFESIAYLVIGLSFVGAYLLLSGARKHRENSERVRRIA
jgi:hypothetical protein